MRANLQSLAAERSGTATYGRTRVHFSTRQRSQATADRDGDSAQGQNDRASAVVDDVLGRIQTPPTPVLIPCTRIRFSNRTVRSASICEEDFRPKKLAALPRTASCVASWK